MMYLRSVLSTLKNQKFDIKTEYLVDKINRAIPPCTNSFASIVSPLKSLHRVTIACWPDESIFAWMSAIDAFLTKLSGLTRLLPGLPKKQLVLLT
jgi:hypothetical protein